MRLISSETPCTNRNTNPTMTSDLAGHGGSPPALPDCSLISTDRMKNGPPVMIITMHSGSRKKAWPTRSMTLRTVFGSALLTISIRICSLSSNVHGEHSRNTTLNNTHCSSSHEFEEVSNVLRTMAFTAEMITAVRINHARRLPVQRVNASIPRLKFSSDCNDRSSPFESLAVLNAPGAQRLVARPRRVPPGSQRPGPHFSAGSRRQLENRQIDVQSRS